jgi:hypothetical protein
MSDRRERELEERLRHLEIDMKSQREWDNIPESQKPTSKGRWEQMANEQKNQESRRLGWPRSY